MSLRARLRPTPALFLALLALVVATAGTSYASAKIATRDLAHGAVTSKKIENDTIRSRDLRDGTVGSRDLRDGSIGRKDLRPGVIPGAPDGVRWALVDATGAIEAQSGGFSVTAAYPVLGDEPTLRANGNVYIDTGEDLSDNGVFATVVLQNTVDQNGDGVRGGRAPGSDANPEFSGEIAVSMCGTPITACAPPGTGTTQHVAISPRLSDGSPTTDADRKRFYLLVTP